ncbi:MAG: hypothetical protein KGI51_14935, partial [Rhodospirillales bacterium]|nr:hypothetical protein [Rhodospirillales bacterium]
MPGLGLAGWLRPGEPAEPEGVAAEHAVLLRRMARELDRFHRDPAALRRIRAQGEERRSKPRVGRDAPIEARVDELNQRLAAVERMLPGGEPTVAAEALSPLRTLLEVLSGEVARLRRAAPAGETSEAAAAAVPDAKAEPAPMPPARPIPSRSETPSVPARRSALIPILAIAAPAALLALVFLDRVPEPVRHAAPPAPTRAAAPAPTRSAAPAIVHPLPAKPMAPPPVAHLAPAPVAHPAPASV